MRGVKREILLILFVFSSLAPAWAQNECEVPIAGKTSTAVRGDTGNPGPAKPPLPQRILNKSLRLSRGELAPNPRVESFLKILRSSFRSKKGYPVFDNDQPPLLIEGTAVPKGDFLEISVIRISLWNAQTGRFYRDGEDPTSISGLESGSLFLDLAQAILVWGLELHKEWPATKFLRIDAMDLKSEHVVKILKVLGFTPWPSNPNIQRLDIPIP